MLLFRPTHLSLFVNDPDTGRPVPRLPLYAEVAVPRPRTPLPAPSGRLKEPIRIAISHVSPGADEATRQRVEDAAQRGLGHTVDEDSRELLITDPQRARELFERVFKQVLHEADRDRLADVKPADLERLIEKALREHAEAYGLGLVAAPEEQTGLIWAEPLGVLATDHVGYASFDLRRLSPDVQRMLCEAIALRRSQPDAVLDVAIWVHPHGHAGRFDALAQARFAFDSVVARLPVKPMNALPPALQNMGPRSLQNPGLTDWRLSPASFAASPKTLLGENGCEELVPSNMALQEFVLRQVVRLADTPAGFALPNANYRPAYVDEYKVSWFSLGHSLGEILYSLPLAPGESVKLAVIDWAWDSLTKRDETTRLTEDVLHQTHRDRTITETVQAGVEELQHGSSFMAGTAGSSGATGSMGTGAMGVGAAVGNTFALGGSTATSDGSRNLAAENVQRINDSFSQASSARRALNSTVVIQARQEEKESIQTRTFSNYNHSHTLTILYYEVLRHYRVTVEWMRRRPAVLAKVPTAVTNFDAATILGFRHLLEPNLIDPALKDAFAILEKQETVRAHQSQHGIVTTNAPTPQWWEGELEFEMFELGMKTTAGGGETESVVVGYVITADEAVGEKKYELHYVYKGSMPGRHNLNAGERFQTDSGQWTFVKPYSHTLQSYVKIKWKDIVGFQFEKWGDDDWRLSFLTINAFGREGLFIPLTEGEKDIDLYFLDNEPSSNTFTWFKRPGPRPAPLPQVFTPERSLTPEELYATKKLIKHFELNKDYYARVLLLANDPSAVAAKFESDAWLFANADPYPLEVFGSWVAYPLARGPQSDDTLILDLAAALNGNDPARRQWAADQLAAMDEDDRALAEEGIELASAKSERLVTMPTRGVFAEGKLGHCNISEEIDNTRFWKWDEHPIPFEAPGIQPVTPISPSPQQVSAAPTPFPASLINIVNPSPAPDPGGLAAALGVIGTPSIFRDMSGKAEVADLLAKLSDNTIGIADAANKAREIQTKYGADLDKHRTDLALGQTQAGAEVAKAILAQRREEAQQVKPNEAQDAIKLSESETRKGNKTPEEHKEYAKQVQQNVKGAQPTPPKRKSKDHIKLQIDLDGYGGKHLVGRFGVTVKQKDADVGFLTATDYSTKGNLVVGVLNEWDDNRYHIEVHGEVLAGLGVNSELRGGNVVLIPRADFDTYDYFYLNAVAVTDSFDFETTKSDEVVKEVAKKIGGSTEVAYKSIVTMTAEGGIEWKDGKTHTTTQAVKVKVVYYTGGFKVTYSKGE